MKERVRRRRRPVIIIAILAMLALLILMPAPTADLAIRKDLLLKQPAKLFTDVKRLDLTGVPIDHGKVMYQVEGISRPFVQVRHVSIGYVVTGSGTGP